MQYIVGFAFYEQELLSLLFLDERKKGFFASLGHHIASVTCISTSFYIGGLTQLLCAMVLFLHDCTDVCLFSFKLAYNSGFFRLSKILGYILLVVYVLCRLVWLPLTLWRAVQNKSSDVVCLFGSQLLCVSPVIFPVSFGALLFMIYVHWYLKLIKVIFKQKQEEVCFFCLFFEFFTSTFLNFCFSQKYPY